MTSQLTQLLAHAHQDDLLRDAERRRLVRPGSPRPGGARRVHRAGGEVLARLRAPLTPMPARDFVDGPDR